MKKAEVTLRGKSITKTVSITGEDKPEVHVEFIEKWQRILNLFSKIIDVPTGLIMRITEESMEVFLKNTNRENPYAVGGNDKLGHGLYCETVIGTDSELVVEDALQTEIWKDNPDVLLNMISYYGVPLKWPDGEFYGTLCVLDDKQNIYSEDFKMILREFKQSIEKDLEILCLNKELRFYSEIDALTRVLNRRCCDKSLQSEFERYQRSGAVFSVAMLDLDHFKDINDTYGHDMGDKVLQVFANVIKERVRLIDAFGRWGGDEFVLICPDTDYAGVQILIDSIRPEVLEKMHEFVATADFSYGVAECNHHDKTAENVMHRADERMYINKRMKLK